MDKHTHPRTKSNVLYTHGPENPRQLSTLAMELTVVLCQVIDMSSYSQIHQLL